jgi:acetyltransferase-like isoleucine patch superfamily enzyme
MHWPQFSVPISTATYEIGEFTYFSPDLSLMTWISGERIIIGKYCSIGEHVAITTGGMRRTDLPALFPFDFETVYRSTANTTLGNDVWVGAHAIIGNGAQIGDGAVVASGAVVFSDVPPFAVVAGNPAQVVRYRFSKLVVDRLIRIAWWHWPVEAVFANRGWFLRPIEEFVEHFDPAARKRATHE